MPEKSKGRVILVGAGPGDPGLISVKGLDAVVNSEVLVYDYLANPEFAAMSQAREKIYVGKTGAAHTMEQEDINELLVKKALEGNVVCRLKGGDPYMFGRGSEEASLCVERGVPVEVVPGIPAAIGAGAYAGVPLTDRRFTSAVMMITGHEDPTKETSSIEWEALAKSKATLVFYMGVKNLPNIADKLMANGMDAATPVAIVEWATTPRMRTVIATLGTAAAVAKEKNVKAPALTIVGGVASLSDELGWFAKQPLFGVTVAVTRTRAQASGLVKQLRSLGANVIEAPTIAIAPPDSWDALDAEINNLSNYDWIIFTSPNAVDSFASRLDAAGKDGRALAGVLIAAIGPATQDKLREYGLRADFKPEKYVGESVAQGLIDGFGVKDKKFLLPRSAIARVELPEMLRKAGALVNEIPSYQTVKPDTDVESLKKSILDGKVTYVTFTSSSTVTHFVELLGEQFVKENKGLFKAASIGPVTTGTLREHGIEPAAEATEYTIPGLVDVILKAEGK